MKYRFTNRARLELLEAGVYYARENRQLLLDLNDEIERAICYLCEFPRAAKLIDRNHRSYKIQRFPYSIIYRLEDNGLVIVAIAHGSRNPGYWRGQLEDDPSGNG
jgi:plasmid stabilization system protein ParE